MKNGTKIEWKGAKHYDFTDPKTKQHKVGETPQCLLTHWRDGFCVKIEICRLSPSFAGNVGDSGAQPVFDQFGRFLGFIG